jgi:hypothetical protein
MTFGIETLFYQRAPPHILLDAIRSQRDWPMPSLQLNLCDIIGKHAEYHPPIDWMKFLVKNLQSFKDHKLKKKLLIIY